MGESLLNGRRCATSARLKTGDVLEVTWRSAPRPGAGRGLDILFEDDHLLAVDKPAGVASHPSGRFQADTVIQFVRDRFAADVQASLSGDGDFYPRLINRLDVFTSGVVLVAKTGRALRLMQGMAAEGKIGKRYIALVEGRVDRDEGRIDLPLASDGAGLVSVRMAVREGGRACVTDFRVLRRLEGHTLLAVFPRSGRQHQIRAHLAAIGHPVRGDLLYRDESLFLDYQRSGGTIDGFLPVRHCLHAEQSEFTHPLTGVNVVIRSPLPEDFLAIVLRCASRSPPDACGASRSSVRSAPAP